MSSTGVFASSAESVTQPRAMRYSTHRPVRTQITTATGKPMNVTNTIPPTTSHNTANQNVRICQPKCESSHVPRTDRKSTRLNSSHSQISYAVFCLKKKKKNNSNNTRLPVSHNTSP